jgi:hypothetical protein
MTAIGGFHSCKRQRHSRSLCATTWLGIVLVIAAAASGCSGCRKSPIKSLEEQKKEKESDKEKEKPKDPFEAKRLVTQPAGGNIDAGKSGKGQSSAGKEPRIEDFSDPDSAERLCKVGHWTGIAWENVKANERDFVGVMEISANDVKGQPLPLPAVPYNLTTARQAALPKGQAKVFDSLVYVPPNTPKGFISCRLSASLDGGAVLELEPPMQNMPSYQYHFIVFARVPEQYGFLSNLHSIKPFNVKDIDNRIDPFYRITRIRSDRHAPLPAYPLLWTSIAYLLWDDAAPSALDPDVQQALLDWLHWGGQLIVSGPDTLDTLKGSFLDSYLPAVASGGCKIGADELAEINSFSGNKTRKLAPVKPWSGIQFQKHPQAEFLPKSGNLLAERRVGRGRIVVSAFRLGEREFAAWSGADEFFNAFLLRRPPRRFVRNQEDKLRVIWADGHQPLDAARITNLRYFTRDAGLKCEDYCTDLPREIDPAMDDVGNARYQPAFIESPPAGPGLAAWNDFNPVAAAVRNSLLNAAQVEIPDRTFIFLFLFIYLIVLVPFNWSIFHTFDRVEWAWIAAPIVAIISTILVIKLAQLDIGFVRARTEIAVLEIQGEHPRGHLTRYNALYTSLSTPYDFSFEDGGALVLPFPSVSDAKLFALAPGQKRRNLHYTRSDQANLDGLPVPSNSTALVHSEEMCDLGGKLSLAQNNLGGMDVVNKTRLSLQGVGLIKKLASGNLQAAWVGKLEPGAVRTVVWVNRSSTQAGGRLWPDERNQSPLTAAKDPGELKGDLNLRNLLDLAEKLENMRPGDVKLLAWMDAALPGLAIKPAAPQSRHVTMVLAHLYFGRDEDPRQDVPDTPN